MARKRFITSDISVDERLARVAIDNPQGALMWPWILLNLDDWGRGTASPVRIKLGVFPAFPFSVEDIQKAIDSFASVGLVYRYEADGEAFMAVRPKSWLKYQTYLKGTKRPKNASPLPEPIGAPWEDDENDVMRQQMARMSADIGECQLMSADVSRQTGMSVPSPSPSPSPLETNTNISVGHDPVPYERLRSLWNEIVVPKGAPEVRALSKGRKAHIKARWNEHHKDLDAIEDWDKFFRWIASDCGNVCAKPWWSFDFVFKSETNLLKCLEGNYMDDKIRR